MSIIQEVAPGPWSRPIAQLLALRFYQLRYPFLRVGMARGKDAGEYRVRRYTSRPFHSFSIGSDIPPWRTFHPENGENIHNCGE